MEELLLNKPQNTLLEDLFHIESFEDGSLSEDLMLTGSFHHVYVFHKGKGFIDIDGTTIAVARNTILTLSKGQVYQFRDNSVSGYRMQFSDSFWKLTPVSANNCKAVLFDIGVVKHRMQVSHGEIKNLITTFELALTEYQSPDYANKPDVLAAYLKIIVIKIANLHTLLQEDVGDDHNKLYQDFVAIVNREVTSVHDVASYAEKLGVSARKLSVTCNLLGTGAKEIINDRLIAEAKRALQFTAKPIKEISSELNFSTPYQFSNFFKKYTTWSPENYRKQFVKIGM